MRAQREGVMTVLMNLEFTECKVKVFLFFLNHDLNPLDFLCSALLNTLCYLAFLHFNRNHWSLTLVNTKHHILSESLIIGILALASRKVHFKFKL